MSELLPHLSGVADDLVLYTHSTLMRSTTTLGRPLFVQVLKFLKAEHGVLVTVLALK